MTLAVENWISLAEVRQMMDEKLSDSSKVVHREVVAHIMRRIAAELAEDVPLWELVALCHDLDEEQTKTDRSKHGILTAKWLDGRLPSDALDAIRAHDHRTGVDANTSLALGLRLADAIAIADQYAGRVALLELAGETGRAQLVSILNARPYLIEMILDISDQLSIKLDRLADIVADAPQQGRQS